MGGHGPNFLPIPKNPSATRRRFKFRRTRTAGRASTGALVSRIENLVDAAGQLTGVRSTFCDRVHLFGPRVRIHCEGSGWMRSDAASLWESECIVIGDQDCFSQHACGHRPPVHHCAGQLPGPRQSVVISVSGGRLSGGTAEFAVAHPAVIAATTPTTRTGIALIMPAFCIESRRLSSRA